MDLGSGLAIFGSAKLVERLLGPTVDYVGEGVKSWTERRVNNVAKIFDNAISKLDDKLETSGQVPPRVLKGILGEGSYCDDDLAREYFGGVLASSRTSKLRDDRGAVLVSLLGRLSTYQIRSHYIFYHTIRKLYLNLALRPTTSQVRMQLGTYIPMIMYHQAMDLDEEEKKDLTIIPHVMYGLQKEGLIEGNFSFGEDAYIRQFFPPLTEAGIVFTPAILGIELFLWALGRSNVPPSDIFDAKLEFAEFPAVTIPDGARRLFIPDPPG